ncbi:ankyrin repeat-containing domain protein [Mycena sanguinolenta]|nr:ankyrin repeat-containing domain protein [Mycena sanguinolenta]
MLSKLPPELILTVVSFLTRETILDPQYRLPENEHRIQQPELIPDLPSINTLSRTNTAFYRTVNQSLYELCTSLEPLGRLVLIYAVEHDLECTLDKLVAAGLSVRTEFFFFLSSNTHNSECGSLLHIAAARGLLSMVICQYLVSEGADINGKSGTPLNYAAGSGNLALVQFMLASGASPNLGFPLFKAARSSSSDIAEALLAAGTDLHAQDDESSNVLAYVANPEMLQFFLERGVDPNLRDILGNTPLHNHACRTDGEAKAWVEVLIQFGASVEAVDDNGHTPVFVAMEHNEPELVKMFEPLVQDHAMKLQIATWWKQKEGNEH